jgi:hypothetical protein
MHRMARAEAGSPLIHSCESRASTGHELRQDNRGDKSAKFAPILVRLHLAGQRWLRLVHDSVLTLISRLTTIQR